MYVMLYTPNSVAMPVGDITYEGKWNKEDNAILWLIFLLSLSKTLLYVNERHTLNAAAELNSIFTLLVLHTCYSNAGYRQFVYKLARVVKATATVNASYLFFSRTLQLFPLY